MAVHLEKVDAAPLDARHELPDGFLPLATKLELATLSILQLYPRAALCEMAGQFPLEEQNRLIQMGLESGQAAVNTALGCRDVALVAFLASVLAVGLKNVRQLGEANQIFRAALVVYRDLARQRPEVYRVKVAKTLNNMAIVQRALNDQEAALASHEEQLQIYRELARTRPEVYRLEVATTLNNLGASQRDLNHLETAQANFEQALVIFRELADHRPEMYQPNVAVVLGELGTVQRELKNLEAALASYEEGVAIFRELEQQRPAVYRPDVAMTLNNLGNVQRDLNNLEVARANFEEALTIRRELARQRPEVYRSEVAKALNNLGNVQRDLNDLESAWTSYEEGLAICRELARQQPEEYRSEVATALNNLGAVQLDLSHLESARACFQEALVICQELARQRPEVYRPYVATTLNNLGNGQRALKELESARTSFEEGLAIHRELARQRPEAYRPSVAMTLNNLGNVQRDLNDLESAWTSYEEGLAIYRELARQRPEVYRPSVAATLNNMANVQCALDNPESARASYQEAVQLYAAEAQRFPTAHLSEQQGAWLNLAVLLWTESVELGWPDYYGARAALREAVRCTELFRRRFRDEKLRKQVQEQGQQAYELLVRTCVDLWDVNRQGEVLREAVEAAERSRNRNLMDRLYAVDLAPVNAPEGWVEAFQSLRRKLEQAQLRLGEAEQVSWLAGAALDREARLSGTKLRVPAPLAESAVATLAAGSPKVPQMVEKLRDEVDRLEQEVKAKLTEARRFDPDFQPEGAAPALKFSQVQQLVPEDLPTALVQFTLSRKEAVVLVITRAEVFPIRLRTCTDRRVWELAQRWFNGYYNEAFRGALQALAAARLGEHSEAERLKLTENGRELLHQWQEQWQGVLPGLLEEVAQLVVHPLLAGLAERKLKVERLIISPHRALHLFPLHACAVEPGEAKTLGREFEVVYAPSLSVLEQCAKRNRPADGECLVVGNPTGDLQFTEAEVAALRARYPQATELHGAAATKEAVLGAAGRSWLLHYSGHATFNVDDQLGSGLVLAGSAGGELLSLREVYAWLNLRRNYLTILNGCESGMLKPDLADEYVTLPSGFLYAGAVCVVSTLWAVHDLSAALLMDRFHAEWQSGKSVAAALREAARWLRQDIRDGRCLVEEILPEFLKHVEDVALRQRCVEAAREHAARHPKSPPFGSPVHWAPFIATGLAYGHAVKVEPDQ